MKSVVILADKGTYTDVRGESANYATARTTASSLTPNRELPIFGQSEAGGDYTVFRSFLKFDTSILSIGAVVLRARLRITLASNTSPDIRIVKHDWSAQDPLTAGNMQAAYAGCLAGGLDLTWTGLPRSGINYSDDLDLTWINRVGFTYYSFNNSGDQNGIAPTGPEFGIIRPVQTVGNVANSPALIIDYIEEPEGYEHLGYQLFVDWDGTGAEESWQNEAPRVTRYALDRGRDRMIGAPGGGLESPAVGRLILEVDNRDGRYDPWNKDGDLYGKLQPGRRANFVIWHQGAHYNLFTGFIADIRPSGYQQTATLIVEDGAGWLNSNKPDIPLLEAQGVDVAIGAILDNLQYPFGREIEPGVNIMDYYWTSGADGLSEIHKLANADMGRFCVDADSTARFRSRYNSDAVSHTITEDQIGKNIYIPMPWDYARSIVHVSVYPRVLGPADSPLWELLKPVTIADGETLTLWCRYRYQEQNVPADGVYVDSYDPVGLDVVLTAFSRDAKVDITNDSGSGINLTELVIKGKPIYKPEPILIEKSAEAGIGLPATFLFDYEWLTDVNVAQSFADVLLAYLNEPKEYPEIMLINRPDLGCAIDLEERLRLVLDSFDIDRTFFVNKISHESGSSIQEIITTIKLHPMLQDVKPNTARWDVGEWDVSVWGL